MNRSLSPYSSLESSFKDFKRMNATAVFENDVMVTIIPLICGEANIHNQQNVLFTELEPIVSNATRPYPDFFDGARLEDLSEKLRNDQTLRSKVVPTKHRSVPVAPNFFLEVKGPNGNSYMALMQALHDGAYGARAMHALQNYRADEPVYDGKAYTFSSTYPNGTLKVYAHFMTAPTTVGGRPVYNMTYIGSWKMTASIDDFFCGVTAFRNCRNLAKRYRDSFVQAATTRAAQA